MDIQTGGKPNDTTSQTSNQAAATQTQTAQSSSTQAQSLTGAQSLVQAHATLIDYLYPVHPERLFVTYQEPIDRVQPGAYNLATRHFCATPGMSIAWLAAQLYGNGNMTGVAALLQANPTLDVSHHFFGGEQVTIPVHTYQDEATPGIKR